MKFLFSAVFVLTVSAILVATDVTETVTSHVSSQSYKCNDTTIDDEKYNKCVRTYSRKDTNNKDCTVSEYLKITVTPTPPNADSSNGVAQCWKTPCDVTEKISIDCESAFGSDLATIEK